MRLIQYRITWTISKHFSGPLYWE